ncbi:ABC transporter transmembrane domain-containing protein [Leucobacter japonicus]|uniref:ABC transporter transmembrane domain-containing protein n=1 Tax=Leucobacter japonicus TaxID=1461259 RepID=UPI0009E4AC3C|nr:ABC transporter ATP-binding protein [Leucobacter japonicus]
MSRRGRAQRAGVTPGAVFGEALSGGRRPGRTALALSGFAAHQFGEVLVPVAVGVVIDHAIGLRDPLALVWSLGLLAAAFLLLIVAWQTGVRVGTRVYTRGEHTLRQRVIGAALFDGSRRRPTGDVLALSASDTFQSAGIFWVAAEIAASVAAVGLSVFVLLGIAWQLAVAAIVGALVQGALVHLVSGPLRRRGFAAQNRAARLDTVGTDFATGFRVLSSLGGAERASERYRAESASAAEAALSAERSSAGLASLATLVSGCVFAGIAALGGWLALHGDVSIGGFVTAMGLAQIIKEPLQTLGSVPAQIAAKHGSARRLSEYLSGDAAPDAGLEDPAPRTEPAKPIATSTANSAPAPLAIATAQGSVVVPPGAVVGVRCDPAHANDLADLLGARRGALPGEISIGGIDASTLDSRALRTAIFAPPHAAAVFSGSAAENLGAPADETHLATAGFDEVVARLPLGLDEPLGERGLRLSGGQRQRLLLARALHQPHEVLVLHEPTTAMDPVTEARIAAALGMAGRTMLLITDRPSLLAACDQVHDLREATR